MSVIRDPLYGPIVLDPLAQALVDTAAFQRLRRIKQLSEATAVYPSAVHTRFEHSVGVHHVARSIVRQLEERGELAGVPGEEIALVPYAALLHDLGHHIGAHLLEEFGWPGISHEENGAALFTTGDVGRLLASTGIPRAGEIVAELVLHQGDHVLGGVVSGACDADKLDYLARDAYHCGLPMAFDQGHLRHALTVVADPATGARTVGIDAEALVSFEQMLLAKSTLFRSVYFHPTVRGAMVMLRALILAALDARLLALDELRTWTDQEIFTILRVRVGEAPGAMWTTKLITDLVERLLSRRLYHRVASLPLRAAPALSPSEVAAVEARLAERLSLAPGEVLLDVPRKPTMLSTDILVRCEDGTVRHAGELGPDDGFALNEAQGALYAASGRVSVYSCARATLPREAVMEAFEAVRGGAGR